MIRTSKLVISIATLVVVLLIIMSWRIQVKIKQEIQADLGDSFNSILNATHESLNTWLKEHKKAIKIWANTPEVTGYVSQLLRLQMPKEELVNTPLQSTLQAWLAPVHTGKGYQAYHIIGPDNITIASNLNQDIGEPDRMNAFPAQLQNMWSGETVVGLPYKSTTLLPDKNGHLVENLPTMFIGTPIFNEQSQVIAVFTFNFDPITDFARIFEYGRLGHTGETYAFDRQGRMISSSRYDDQLHQTGLLAPADFSMLTLELKNPGVNLLNGESSPIPRAQQPFTKMVSSALAGRSGMDMEGYRNYRGVFVVGSWVWDAPLNFGIAIEADEEEVYKNLRFIQLIILILTTVAILLILGMTVTYLVNRKRQLAEIAFRKSEEKYRQIFETIVDVYGEIGLDGIILEVSPSILAQTGYSREELIGRHTADFYARPGDRDQLLWYLNQHGAINDYEVLLIDKFGNERLFSFTGKIVHDTAGKPLKLSGSMRDIGERKRVSEALAKAHEKLEARVQERTAELAQANSELKKEIGERQHAEQVLHRRDAILRAMTFGAEQFLKSTSWHENIQEVLNRLIDAAQVSYICIFENQLDHDGQLLAINSYECAAPGNKSLNDNPLFTTLQYKLAGLGRWVEILGQGKVVHGHLREFPAAEQKTLGAVDDFKSVAIVPVFVEGKWWGFIGYAECSIERKWLSAEIDTFKILADFLGARIQREKAERLLHQERDRAQYYLDTVEAIIVALDHNGDITLINRKGCELLGYSEKELLGKNWFSTCLPQPEGKEEVYQVFKALLAGEQQAVEYFENPVLTRSGEQRIIAWHNKYSCDADGNIIGTLGAGEDITARKLAQEALRDSEEMLEAMLNATTDAVVLLDREGIILNANFSLADRHNTSRPDIIGTSVWDLYPPELLVQNKALVESVFQTGKPRRFEDQWRDMSNDHVVYPIHDLHGKVSRVVVFSHDITDRKNAEEQNRLRQAELAHLARLNTMGEMATGIAHELNQPLTAIVTYAGVCQQLVTSQENLSPTLSKSLEAIRVQAMRAADIISHLRDFVRKQKPHISTFNLNEVVNMVIEFVAAEVRNQNVQIHFVLDPQLPSVKVDVIQIEQVLLNLVRNSLEALNAVDINNRHITVRTSLNTHNQVQIDVTDNGPGMDAKMLNRIFDSLFSTKGNAGLGMGLSISRTIIETHEGKLWADSQIGGGTSMHFVLPVVA